MRRSSIFLIAGLAAVAYGVWSGAFVEAFAMIKKPKFAGTASPYDDIIEKYCGLYGVDPLLVRAIIRQESNWDPDVPGFDGKSIGLMQITLPLAYDFLGRDSSFEELRDPDLNIRIGVWDLRKNYDLGLEGDIASFNEGRGNWLKGKKDSIYVNSVMAFYDAYKRG